MKDNEQIHRYTTGEMTATQRTTFEKRLTKEPALRKALEMYRDLDLFSDIKSNTSLQNSLKNLGDAHFGEEKKTTKVITLKRFVVAAAAVLLLAFGLWWLMNPLHIRLYKQVAHAELSIAIKQGNEADIQKMEALYNDGAYQKAIPLLRTYSNDHPDALNVRIALCISFIEVGEYDTASKFLEEIRMGDSAYKWEATFYLALLYLKQGDMEEYNKYLDEIPKSSPVYKRVKELKR